jgi:tripartite ATP-independent transporter DctM subunit
MPRSNNAMNDILIVTLLIVSLFGFLAGGVWVGLTLAGTAWIGMELFSSRPAGDAMAITIWGASSSWTLTALPLFLWMGEILFRTRLSQDLFKGLAPWLNKLPGRLLHTNVIGCAIFAAVSGSSAATCATIGKMTLPELKRRGYPDDMVMGTLAGAGTLGLLIPPSIIMIVYGVAAEVSIAKLFIAGVLPGIFLALLFMGYIIFWAVRNPEKVPLADAEMSFKQKIYQSRHLIPVLLLITAVLGSIYSGVATATEAAAIGVLGSLIVSVAQGSLTWETFKGSLLGATRLYCMIALILAGAQFLTLSMGYIGLPRALAEWIGTLGLSQFGLILVLMVFFIILGCFLDGISMVVLTMGVLLPTVTAAGIDLIWFGIFIVFVVEMAQITPPVGFNLFVLSGMTGRELPYIARVSFPLFLLMVGAVMFLYFVPELATFLPKHMKL